MTTLTRFAVPPAGEVPVIDLYEHNADTYERLVEHWKTERKAAIIQATGSGKSFLILRVLFDNPTAHKIVLVPNHHIADQIKKSTSFEIPNTTFLTYKKVSMLNEDEISMLSFDFVVLDEFHRAGAEIWGLGVKRLLEANPNAYVLGLSATPIRYLDGARGMSDELFDGHVITNLSLSQAIVRGILPMPKYVSALYTLDEVILNMSSKIDAAENSAEEKKGLHKQLKEMQKRLDESKGVPVILAKHLDMSLSVQKLIVFFESKAHMEAMRDTVKSWFGRALPNQEITDYVITYEQKSKYNDISINKFERAKSGIHLMMTIDKLNEGLHIDGVSGVMFLRPTQSSIVYHQQLGRGISAGSGKKPLVLDLVNNFDNLGSQDFASDLKEAAEKENRAKEEKGQELLSLEDFLIYDELHEARELFEWIGGRLHNSWDHMYALLLEYREREGHVRVVRGDIISETKKLEDWVNTQRQNFKKKKISQDKIEKLDYIEFIWSVQDSIWEQKFEELRVYIKENGTSIIPRNCELDERDLELWIRRQRQFYRTKKLSLSRIERLNSVGFVWSSHDESWNHAFNILKLYADKYGNIDPPKNCRFNGFKIGIWANSQRTAYQSGGLLKERENSLKSIGFRFETAPNLKNSFEKNLKRLEVYAKENAGSTQVPFSYVDAEGFRLGVFCNNVRQDYKRGKLPPERESILRSLGVRLETKPRKTKE